MSKNDERSFNPFDELDDQAFLGKTYIAVLGRPVDPSGFRDYMSRLRSGVPRLQIWEELASSDEARAYAGRKGSILITSISGQAARADIKSVADLVALDGNDFIEQAYWALLGRKADPAGFKHYSERLAAGISKMQIVADIHSDQEGRAYGARLAGIHEAVRSVQSAGAQGSNAIAQLLELPDESFLRGVYRLILRREPDDQGKKIYSTLLASGMSRMYVVREIAMSTEGSAEARKIKGLSRLIKRYEKANLPTWGGWYLRAVKGVESDLPMERQARAIAYSLRVLVKGQS